jgi:hypothetical protein
MDPKGKGMVINDKEKESLFNEPRDDKPTDSGSSHKKRDGKKRHIKKIIYYDSDASSSSPRDDEEDDGDNSSPRQRKRRSIKIILLITLAFPTIQMRIYYQFPLENLHILMERTIHFWSHKMRSHLFYLHPSIWEIVENGMHFDSTNNPVFINEQIHKNAQATTVLLACLCRDEYNKVSGLDNAKQI